ncbi:MAG: hypothetical protein RL092_284 [Bacteroidota bacterium]|jgi:hypothetical protein
MRIVPFLVLVVSLFFPKSTLGQGVLKPIHNGWERIYIKDVGYFDIPPTMEIQQGKYRDGVEEVRITGGEDTTQLTVQQKGLNNFNSDSFKIYGRVMLNSLRGEDGDYFNSNFDLSFFSAKEKIVVDQLMNDIVQKEVLSSPLYSQGSLKIIEWTPAIVEKVNGQVCVHWSYRRQLLEQPIVYINCYQFHNYDRVHMLTLEYRENESDLWKADFEKVLDSFRITNSK